MKKIFTTIIALAITTFGFCQSLHIFENGVDVTNSFFYDTISSSELTVHDMELHNTTSNMVNYKVSRTILSPSLDADANVYFCTGTQCYSPQTATTWIPTGPDATIAANSNLPNGPNTYGIAAHYDAGAVSNNFTVKYYVYNTMTAGDTATVTIYYVGETVGIEESRKLANGSISNAYPNPATSMASIKYDMNEYAQKGKVAFYDMLGNKVKEIELTEKQGVLKIDITEFKSGAYFYSFMINDKAIATKKMIVSK